MGRAIFLTVFEAPSYSKQKRSAYRGGSDGLPRCRPEQLLSVDEGPQRRELMSKRHRSYESRARKRSLSIVLLLPPRRSWLTDGPARFKKVHYARLFSMLR